MGLEEPELHIPPAIQRKLIHRLQALSSQSIITTHSPTIAAIADPVEVLVLGKFEGVLKAVPLLDAPLKADAPNSIRKLFQLNRVDTISALMHDWVLIPEGRTEFDWLRLLIRAVDLRQGWVDANSNEFGMVRTVPSGPQETKKKGTPQSDPFFFVRLQSTKKQGRMPVPVTLQCGKPSKKRPNEEQNRRANNHCLSATGGH
jgi:hypothetical protein